MKYLLALVIIFLGCGGKPKPTKTEIVKPSPPEKPEIVEPLTPEKTEAPRSQYLIIEVKNFGKIKIELYKDDAPKNVANIVKLAKEGFYNGLKFHRVIPGFVIQGGDPKGDGTGGPGYTIDAEISPKLKHLKGTVAMARLPDQINPQRASSGSQFYICLEPQPRLDGAYTIIGQVVEGMEVVDKIGQVKTDARDMPAQDVIMEKVSIMEE